MKQELVVWLAAFGLSLAQWHHVAFFFGNDFSLDIQGEQGNLNGYPFWRFFQSRMLAIWMEKFVMLFGADLVVAHIMVAVVALAICGVVMFHAGRDIAGRQAGWSALLALHVLFALMMAQPWLYIWDYFVLLTGAVFMLLMIHGAPWWAFVLLMSVSILNHESALFIGVWMVAKALADAWTSRRPDWWMLGGGVAGSLAGIVLIEILRTVLLKREIGWEFFKDAGVRPTSQIGYFYFHLQLLDNLNHIYRWIVHADMDFVFLRALPLVVVFAMSVMLVVRHGMKAAPLAVYGMTQVIMLLLLATVAEIRTALQLVPFLCLGGMLAGDKPEAALALSGRSPRSWLR